MSLSRRCPSCGQPAELVLAVVEAAQRLGISRRHAYELIAAGRLPHVSLGQRLVVPVAALEEWLHVEASHSVRDERRPAFAKEA